MIADCIGGAIFWFLIISFLHVNNRKALFLVPYIPYLVFATFWHSSVHHLGLGFMYMVFVLWVIYQEDGVPAVPAFFKKIESGKIRKIAGFAAVFLLLLSPACTVASCIGDIRIPYGTIEIVNFIKKNHLEDRKIMAFWDYQYKSTDEDFSISDIIFDETLPVDLPEIEKGYPYIIGIGASVNPYFNHNVFMNFNADDPDCLYMKWKKADDVTAVYKTWHDQGLPDFIIGTVPLQEIYSEEELDGVTYYWIDEVTHGKVWKFETTENTLKVFIRSDLLDEYPQFEIQTYAKKAKEPT